MYVTAEIVRTILCTHKKNKTAVYRSGTAVNIRKAVVPNPIETPFVSLKCMFEQSQTTNDPTPEPHMHEERENSNRK